MSDFRAARLHMVQSQLKTNRITDPRLLEVITEVPRERFVPEVLCSLAYVDEDLALGRGRHLMEPMVFAHLVQASQPGPDDIVLDVGCATGYSSVVLASLAGTVVALESDDEFAAEAAATFVDLAIGNAVTVRGALPEGYAEQGPYDAIMLNGAVEVVPERLTDQLAEGGRLVAVVNKPAEPIGQVTLMRREGGIVSSRTLLDAAIPLLPGFVHEAGFAF